MGIRTIRTVIEELPMSITDKIRKAFMENSSSLIFRWHPPGHMASISEAKRTLQMAVQVERMICKSLNIFQIRNPVTILQYIWLCVTGVLGLYMCHVIV